MKENDNSIVSKNEAIHRLPKIKLVIGNGFDLHCGMHSSYADYFNSVSHLNTAIEAWANGFNTYMSYLTSNDCLLFWRKMEHFDIINVWDCFFFFRLNKDIPNKEWCDIEAEIGRSFSSTKTLPSFWEKVLYSFNPTHRDYEKNVYLLSAFIKHKRNEILFSNEDEFYSYLLNELKLFESRFGAFIKNQQNDEYYLQYECLVNNLCNYKELVSIESFNYSVFRKEGYHQININGDYNQPIFGIDSKIVSPNSPEYIFTKTYRRIEQDTDNKRIEIDLDFENIVVYGHSLCSHDFSYFFPLMDKIKLYDFTANGQIVFAYSVYDKKRSSEIKTAYRFAISKIITSYANYRGLTEPNRLLDSLSIFRRIWIYEIEIC